MQTDARAPRRHGGQHGPDLVQHGNAQGGWQMLRAVPGEGQQASSSGGAQPMLRRRKAMPSAMKVAAPALSLP